MSRHLLALVVGVAIGLQLYATVVQLSAANPPDSHQQNPDIYQCCGFPSVFAGTTSGDLSSLNPITQSVRGGSRVVTYSYTVVTGCADGNMHTTLVAALAATAQAVGLRFTEVASGGQVRVRATCGVDFANLCGGPPVIACLAPSWPYQSQVNATTTMATFYDVSQQAIWLHEVIGHGVSTWHEQYQLGGSFAATPGLVDYMNTGPDSRHIWPQNDLDRWERTMYPLTQAPPAEWCCDTVYPGWEGMGVSRLHLTENPPAWYWGIKQVDGREFLYRFVGIGPWICISGCR